MDTAGSDDRKEEVQRILSPKNVTNSMIVAIVCTLFGAIISTELGNVTYCQTK